MIRKLRIKFICVIMAIVMVLLGGILGVVFHFTQQSLEVQSISMMRAVASIPFEKGSPGKPPMEGNRPPAFVVQIGAQGEIIVVEDGGTFVLSDQDYLRQVIEHALASDREYGDLKEDGLRYLKARNPMGLTIVFTDTAAENATMTRLIYNSFLIFSAAMLVFLGITILLSHWVIKPVEIAWDQQRQFVADASHELKTPLSIIMTNAELMQNEDTREDDRRKFSQNILSVTYQMRSLVENMLEMARVDSDTVKAKFTALDFSQLVSDSVLSFQLLYAEKGLGLVSSVSERITIHGSEQHLYQVMDVLLDNALKYSTPGGMVSVSLTSNGRSCMLSVASPGDPISKEDLKNIFKRFYRTDKARTMNGSYGLGLSIAESIVTAHKGTIWAESSNGWNTFYIQMPTGS